MPSYGPQRCSKCGGIGHKHQTCKAIVTGADGVKVRHLAPGVSGSDLIPTPLKRTKLHRQSPSSTKAKRSGPVARPVRPDPTRPDPTPLSADVELRLRIRLQIEVVQQSSQEDS